MPGNEMQSELVPTIAYDGALLSLPYSVSVDPEGLKALYLSAGISAKDIAETRLIVTPRPSPEVAHITRAHDIVIYTDPSPEDAESNAVDATCLANILNQELATTVYGHNHAEPTPDDAPNWPLGWLGTLNKGIDGVAFAVGSVGTVLYTRFGNGLDFMYAFFAGGLAANAADSLFKKVAAKRIASAKQREIQGFVETVMQVPPIITVMQKDT
jgi:hypothetical protein